MVGGLGFKGLAERDWKCTSEPAPAPHLEHPEGCAALRIVLITVPRVSRSCEHFPDGFDLHLQQPVPFTHWSRSSTRGLSDRIPLLNMGPQRQYTPPPGGPETLQQEGYMEQRPHTPTRVGTSISRRISSHNREREFFIDNLLVRVHFILVMLRWTGLAPWVI